MTPAVGRGAPRDRVVRDVVLRRSVWYAGSGGLSQVSPDHGADVFWVIRQDVPECDTPEPGVELGTACDEGEDDPLVRAIDVEVVPRDLSKDVRVDASIEREFNRLRNFCSLGRSSWKNREFARAERFLRQQSYRALNRVLAISVFVASWWEMEESCSLWEISEVVECLFGWWMVIGRV